MTQRWRKGGLIYAPTDEWWWAHSYATIPTAEVIDEHLVRVYFAALDHHHFGRIGYVEVDASNPQLIVRATPEPVLDLGELGSFDDSGVNPSCTVNIAGNKYLYYIGWQRCERVPYMLFSGLAVSEDGGQTFRRHARTPVLDRTSSEPFSRSAPCVRVEDGIWKVWYWSCVAWSSNGGRVHYNNVIRYATSPNGIHWTTDLNMCIEPAGEEYSVGRPWVIFENGMYRMWYSIRSHGAPYRIGYAESTDGINWLRQDDTVGMAASLNGWDSEMICYPCVVDVSGKRYMFYNGNQHGASGFGYAILESE